MNNFIKENWFKLVVCFSIILISLSVSYYFFIYLPEVNNTKETLENQIKCQQEGNERYEKDIEEGKTGSFVNYYYHWPEFKFNRATNTCLYKVQKMTFIGDDYTSNTSLIKDVYTNKEVFSWTQSYKDNEWKDTASSREEWNKKYNELFGN